MLILSLYFPSLWKLVFPWDGRNGLTAQISVGNPWSLLPGPAGPGRTAEADGIPWDTGARVPPVPVEFLLPFLLGCQYPSCP